MRNKAFTLIELLAVIIILGMLMLIAIPSVTNYINESRKNSYVTTIKELIKGTTTKVNSGDIEVNDTDKTYYIPCSCIDTENGKQSSPYGEFDPAYIVATFDGENYNYYFTGKDVQNIGIPKLLKSDLIANDSIITNISSIDTTIGIRGTSEVVVYNSDCSRIESTNPASTTTSGKSKRACTTPPTEIIYWALNDTDSDSKYDKLVISDEEVNGDMKGSFSKDTQFRRGRDIPWINANSTTSIESIGLKINTVIIEGNVAPIYTSYWFDGVGYSTDTFTADLTNLEVCNVIDMNNMFAHTAYTAKNINISDISDWDVSNVKDFNHLFYNAFHEANEVEFNFDDWDISNADSIKGMFSGLGYWAKEWNIGTLKNWDISNITELTFLFNGAGRSASRFILDLSNWNTSKVTSMYALFADAGADAKIWSIGDISNWNTSNVTDMKMMFCGAAYSASNINIDLSRWNTSNVTNMENMFNSFGAKSETWSLGNISNWNVSNVTNMNSMFSSAAQYATTVNLDLSRWNTSNVTSMDTMFNYAFFKTNSLNLNMSGFNTSSVTNINNMFYYTGYNTNNWQVIIPKTNGNGIDNTTTKIYGADSSVFAEPHTSRNFTLAT